MNLRKDLIYLNFLASGPRGFNPDLPHGFSCYTRARGEQLKRPVITRLLIKRARAAAKGGFTCVSAVTVPSVSVAKNIVSLFLNASNSYLSVTHTDTKRPLALNCQGADMCIRLNDRGNER